ncbi:RNA polymerase sigma factor [Breznakia pachnodae]|uniref:RNA polymerase sigma factor (Sigma-70 family) n=1 Tax=Breznakia pachnodae TaxID=265178 RepID=A0ABU0E2P5_9FIRM|nr:sigma-70 family RNA polymerase sigma factor [Breznakia pachnodae]MDQ0360996.1 RNA polymerase sigma factor (sigma-70 family) [Breznakia pachnodae]
MENSKIESKYIESFMNGDISAFEEIFNFYKDSIYYLAILYVKNAADAEEIVQSTFITVYRKIGGLKSVDSFHFWIYKIACRHAISVYNKNKKSNTVQFEDTFGVENIVTEQEIPNEMASNLELVEYVKKIVQGLPPKMTIVAQLRYFEQLSVIEIAEILDVPVGTVKSRLMRVRTYLKPKMKAKGFTPETYLSVSASPLLFGVFQSLIKESAPMMNAGEIVRLAGTAAGGISAQLIAKFVGIALLGGALSTGAYHLMSEETKYIEQISYNDQLTKNNLEVEMLLSSDSNPDIIEVTKNNQVLDVQVDGNTVTFIVEENGEYNINVDDDRAIVKINNIDKKNPILSEVAYSDNTLSYTISDDLSGIDYEKSYLEDMDGNQYRLNSDNTVQGEFIKDLYMHLYDTVGNYGKYEINISK